MKKGSMPTSGMRIATLGMQWVKCRCPCNDGLARGEEVVVPECQGMARSLARSHLVWKGEAQAEGERESAIVHLSTSQKMRLSLPQPSCNFGSYLAKKVINVRQIK